MEKTYPPYTKEDFLSEVFMPEEEYEKLSGILRIKKNIILQGAPGVGKTFAAKRIAFSMMGVKDVERVMMVQFHQSYSYEDFIMGFRPSTDGFELMDFLDEQRMCRLYEKFILEYYKKHYPKLTVSASHIPWALDDGIGDMLPVMQSDIHFQKENTVLIIDAKYYTNTTQVQFDKHTLHSNNLYQIFTYVKNREYQFGDEENKVSGMLLYARTDALIQPDNVYQMHGNQISVKTLDLNKPFDEIAKQLDEIAAAHFDGIEKTI